ncbi:MAG TPA: alpha/beta hydrolase [Polyangiaceae bacterium]|jgi:pimeloyl-ACP methyl ester carboxylesterase|nr:alpha/beta hydrolase [Polyangiaceae bacterium]
MQIRRNGVALGYEEAGKGSPALLLVHGWGLDRSALRPTFDWACRTRRVVAVDLRGFGESDKPKGLYPIAQFADDLAFTIETLELGASLVIGHSLGGSVVLDLAARHPALVAAAALLEPMVVPAPGVLAGLQPMLAGVRSSSYRERASGVMSYLTQGEFPPDARQRLMELAANCEQHVLVSALEGLLAYDSGAAASKVRCPLLYVGTTTVYADLQRFQRLCPQLEVEQLAGLGHYFPLQAPEALHQVLEHFIRDLT